MLLTAIAMALVLLGCRKTDSGAPQALSAATSDSEPAR